MADFIWLTAVRLLGALLILIVPLPGLWLCGHVDRWDWSLLGMASASAHEQQVYQYWDKSIDTFTLAMALVVALTWNDVLVRRLAIATFAWRAAGVAIFMATGQREVLVVFPNVFERLFFFYLVFRLLSRRDLMLRGSMDAVVVMVALTLPKIADEYFVHVAARPWQTMTLLPAAMSTPDREYWVWMPIMLALPAAAMARVLLRSREATGEERLGVLEALSGPATAPVSAFLGRQAGRLRSWRVPRRGPIRRGGRAAHKPTR